MEMVSPLISKSLGLNPDQVNKTILLLKDGATIPFISRYRKELTGSLDEVQILQIKEAWEKNLDLEKRRETVIKSISDQNKLSEELLFQLKNCPDITTLEDLYLPYKVKRKTKASIAKGFGLEPLADYILLNQEKDCQKMANSFLNENIKSVEEALSGARDIIAEKMNEDHDARNILRNIFQNKALFSSKVIKSKSEDAQKFKDYFSYEEPIHKCPSHRVLAAFRGESEGFLRVSIEPNEDVSIKNLESYFLKKKGENAQQITIAIKDAYKRLLLPSIENEFRNLIKEKADKEAIAVFAENLKQLLLSPPLGSKRVLAIDPGFKSGCKIVCLDENGDLIHNENIYPHPPQNESGKAAAKINQLVSTYKIEAIAIGNGTAGRETENFIRNIRFSKDVQVFVVNENGASIYSASSIAREEFPEYDVTVRGSVSIGRRLMDPLAELVKIDPKSIGVGQYQHDVDQSLLKISLDTVVESAVNKVGINLNTASKHLLSYVSGIGVQIAQNIVDYRTKCGPFKNRSELLLVARLGNKAFEQCAGFLRIKNGESILDNTAVHPESYHVVEKMAKDAKIELHELIENDEIRKSIHLEKYVDEKIGLPTLKDILQELSKPGLDPRKIIKVFEFAKGISKPEHLTVGMKLPGIITNITNFGAFVDIGVKQDGLVHISNLADKYVSNPADVVHLNQQVYVTVLEIDLPRKRIGLSLKS